MSVPVPLVPRRFQPGPGLAGGRADAPGAGFAPRAELWPWPEVKHLRKGPRCDGTMVSGSKHSSVFAELKHFWLGTWVSL